MTRGSLSGDLAAMTTTITDPVTGERCHWLVTASETGGRFARAEWWVPPGAGACEVRLEVLAGQLTVLRGGERLALGPGDDVRVPPAWLNEGTDEVHLVIEITPNRSTTP